MMREFCKRLLSRLNSVSESSDPGLGNHDSWWYCSRWSRKQSRKQRDWFLLVLAFSRLGNPADLSNCSLENRNVPFAAGSGKLMTKADEILSASRHHKCTSPSSNEFILVQSISRLRPYDLLPLHKARPRPARCGCWT